MRRREFTQAMGGGLAVGFLDASSQRTDPLDELTIKTDEYSVSHIYVPEDADRPLYALGYGIGYRQARHRLVEMDLLRHVGYGESAEVFGPSQLASDIQVKRDLYSKEELEAQFERADAETRQTIEGFSAGVNRAIVELAGEGQLPGEFYALGHAPEPWQPRDTVAIIAYLQGFFGVFGGEELHNAKTFAQLTETLGSKRAAFAAYGDLNTLTVAPTHTTAIDADERTVDGGESVPAFDAVPDEQLDQALAARDAEIWGVTRVTGEGEFTVPDAVAEGRREAQGALAGFKWGSNAFIVDGELTETGKPMLFGGPQVGYFKPPIFYEVGLHGPERDVVGVGTVGTPGLVIGRTTEYAWSITSGYEDQVDTVTVELHPEDRHRYRWQPDGEWQEMDCRTVVHRASPVGATTNSGRPDTEVVVQEICRIHEQDAEFTVIAWNESERLAWAQRTTTRGEELVGSSRLAKVPRRDDFEGVTDQLGEFPFSFNVHYVDADTIGFIHTGKIPDREPGVDFRLPVPSHRHGWTETRYTKDLAGEDEPIAVTNPEQGYVANWNNAPVEGWRTGDTEQLWGSVHRVVTLEDAVQDRLDATGGDLSFADVQTILRESATHDPFARETAPHMIAAAERSDDPRLSAMADALRSWRSRGYPWRDANGDDRYDSGGMAVWEAARRALQRLVFADELAERTPTLQFDPRDAGTGQTGGDPHAGDHGSSVNEEVTLVDALTGRTEHDWFGDTPIDVFEQAMERAADALVDEYGDPAPQMPERKSRFFPIGGGIPNEIDMTNRGSWNQLVAIGEGLAGSKSVLPPANSGHLSGSELARTQGAGDEPARLTDQLELYRNFSYKPFPVTDDQVERVTVRTDELTVSHVPDQTVAGVDVPNDLPGELLATLTEPSDDGQPSDG